MFSKANAKLIELQKNPKMQGWLQNRRKVYSFDLISGHSCPFAEECLAKVKVVDGRRKVIDGPKMEFRCFSASQEALLTNVYNKRLTNFNMLRGKTLEQMVHMISGAMPHNLGIGRIHVAGDFFNPVYFRAWMEIALLFPDRLFYAYTKSLVYWLKNLGNIPENLILTASNGGKHDSLIEQLNLRSAAVVYSYEEAEKLGLEVDHDDSHAANPLTKDQNFALMIHGVQPAGSEASAAVQTLKNEERKFSYSK
jgi:hypothetical protein